MGTAIPEVCCDPYIKIQKSDHPKPCNYGVEIGCNNGTKCLQVWVIKLLVYRIKFVSSF